MRKPIKIIILFASILSFIFVLVYLSLLNQRVTDKLDGALWTLPAKLYSRSLEIGEGTKISLKNLRLELDLLSYEESHEVRVPGEYKFYDDSLKIFLRGFEDQKSEKFEVHFQKGDVTSIKRVDGISIDLIRLEPMPIGGMYPSHMQDRLLLDRSQVPEELIEIILLVEDKSFFDHQGICYRCIFRALIENVKAQEIEQGGSTITQQLAKSLFFSSEKTLRRKIKEALAAFLIEFHYSKEQILLAYINDVFVAQSGRRAIHGFGLASEYFFGTSVENLSKDQMALLVGMLKGPSLYNPAKNKEKSKERRDLVLNLLLKDNLIGLKEFSALKKRPIKIIKPTYKSQSKYPYFSDLVTLDLKKNFEDRDLRTKGLSIHTNLDPVVQTLLENSLLETKQDLVKKYGSELNELQGAAIVIDSFTGVIHAATGNINPKDFGFNRVINAVRPIGSLVKPFIYLTALREYKSYNLSTLIDDSKLSVQLHGGDKWEPSNFDKKYHGLVPLHKALWDSYNIASTRLGLELGYDLIEESFKDLGIIKAPPHYPSVFVGSFEMSPFDAIQAYQTIASGGFFSPISAVREVRSLKKGMTESFPYKTVQKFRPEPIYLLQFILKQTFERGTARGYSDQQIKKWRVGGKTGTSDEQRDSWFAGYAGDYLVLVWLGFDDNRKSPLTGRSGALQVWKKLINQLDPVANDFRKPSRIEYEWVDINDGLLSGKDCVNSFLAPFIKGTKPKVIPVERKQCRVNENSNSSKVLSKIRKAIIN